MKALEIVERVKEVVEPELAAHGFEVVDAEYRREPVGMVLRFYVDRQAGIDLEACAQASELISGLLDRRDILKGSYTLEVSSPGIARRLTKPEHFQRFVGSKAQVKTIPPLEGRRRFTGVIVRADADGFTLDMGEAVVAFKYSQVAKANLVFTD